MVKLLYMQRLFVGILSTHMYSCIRYNLVWYITFAWMKPSRIGATAQVQFLVLKEAGKRVVEGSHIPLCNWHCKYFMVGIIHKKCWWKETSWRLTIYNRGSFWKDYLDLSLNSSLCTPRVYPCGFNCLSDHPRVVIYPTHGIGWHHAEAAKVNNYWRHIESWLTERRVAWQASAFTRMWMHWWSVSFVF